MTKLDAAAITQLKQAIEDKQEIVDVNSVLLSALIEIERLRGLLFSNDSFNHGICC